MVATMRLARACCRRQLVVIAGIQLAKFQGAVAGDVVVGGDLAAQHRVAQATGKYLGDAHGALPALDKRAQAADVRGQALLRRADVLDSLHQRLPWLGLHAVEDRVQQIGLADELAAHGGRIDVRLKCHGLQSDRVVALLEKHPASHVDDMQGGRRQPGDPRVEQPLRIGVEPRSSAAALLRRVAHVILELLPLTGGWVLMTSTLYCPGNGGRRPCPSHCT
jgi:hypothetical protein